MRMLLVLTLVVAFAAASYSCGKGKSGSRAGQNKKVGACDIDTITIGTGITPAEEAPAGAAWIRVNAVDSVGNDLFKKAADDLKEALEQQAVPIYSCTELTHVKSGPCWPAYSVEFRINLTERAADEFHRFLEQTAIANKRPAAERPQDYGQFFISCGMGSSDWWTVWYEK
ncbi:MAG TPA: hypothetical protein VII85_04620 [Candidatus Krumholzibacteriaceae bacterium]